MIKIFDRRAGICDALLMSHNYDLISTTEYRILVGEMHGFLQSKGWHSGDKHYYPIKHPRLNAQEAFWKCSIWTRLTTYGRRRRATLAHLNKYLEELRNA